MDDGWIILARTADEHPCLEAFDARGVWEKLLLKAAFAAHRTRLSGQWVDLERGQLAVAVSSMAEAGGITRKRMRTILGLFRSNGMIEMVQAKGHAFTIITICNYDVYQALPHQKGQAQGQRRAKLGPSKGQAGANRDKEGNQGKTDSPNGESESMPDLETGFREFYAAYPRKVAPGRAANAYRAARKRTDHDLIMDGVRRAKLAWERNRTEPGYIPHPATWLNDRRWSDDDFIAGNGSADPIGDADRMTRTILRKMDSNERDQEFAGTHSLVPNGPPPSVWSWPEDDGGASDLAEQPLYRSLIGPPAGNA